MQRLSFFILFSLLSYSTVSAFVMPFSDVSDTTEYAASLNALMANGNILDDGNGKFSGESPATRVFLSSLLLASRCQSCIIPSTVQVSQYAKKTLSGIESTHPYYYCAQETTDAETTQLKPSCMIDGESGFCPNDSLTRIEAAKAFLEYNKLLNTSTDIRKRAIELGIIDTDSDDSHIMTRGELVSMASKILAYNQCQPTPLVITNSGISLTASGNKDTFIFSAIGSNSSSSYRWSLGDGILRTTTIPELAYTYTTPGEWKISVFGNATIPTLATVSIRSTGVIDSDSDGIMDDIDICPLVYGVATNAGCPVFATQKYRSIVEGLLAGTITETTSPILSGLTRNACVLTYQKSQGLVIGAPVCDTCPCQNKVSILSEVRSCDIIFPSILSPDASLIYSRGAFYQIP